MDGYKPKDIANGDETDYFFVHYQTKLCLKGERCSGGKLCKERLTVFFHGFMTGEIEKPLVIGRAAKPRCFKNIDIKKHPVDWKSNKKPWITSHIMEEWLTAFNVKMKWQNHSVLFFWTLRPAILTLNCPTCGLRGSHPTPQEYLIL
jgi:hypothetical protein